MVSVYHFNDFGLYMRQFVYPDVDWAKEFLSRTGGCFTDLICFVSTIAYFIETTQKPKEVFALGAGHGHKGCPYFVLPKTRTEWWFHKIKGTMARDKAAEIALNFRGWKVIII